MNCARKQGEIDQIFEQIQQAYKDAESNVIYGGDMENARFWAGIADRLEESERILSHLKKELADISDAIYGPEDIEDQADRLGLRTIRVRLSEGMINQNLLTLTTARKRGVVKKWEKMEIHPEGAEAFTTDIVSPGNRLRERSRIKEFYLKKKASAGDTIILVETAEGVWSMRHQPDVSELWS